VSTQLSIVEIDCPEVRRELVNYAESDLTPELAKRIELHLKTCRHCVAVYDGARNVVSLFGDKAVFQLPEGFSQRLHQKFATHLLTTHHTTELSRNDS
jgi:predicted anti-sigma-YlaC factor YlaD